MREIRCPGCYLPMRPEFAADWWRCFLCDSRVPAEKLADRGRLRRIVDRLTGMVGVA